MLWADILDRNIADLYFKRGSYSAALRSLEKVRSRYQEQGDDRRLALSDLARAEIYLQLNLAQEAGELAEKAQSIFERHSNRSEAAQCLTLVGIARLERGEDRGAAESFRQATHMFEVEGNAVSAAAARLQLARLEQKRHDHAAAISLALSAAQSFESEQLAVRGAYARITLAQSLREQGRVEDAIAEARGALDKLTDYHAEYVTSNVRRMRRPPRWQRNGTSGRRGFRRPDTYQFHLVRDIAPELAVRTALKGLNFQLAKFHLGQDYLKQYHETLLAATRHHLEKLHDMLIAPLAQYIQGRSLALVPHGVLHYVPFQALYDGKDHLIDRHAVVYSASATVLKICRMKQPQPSELDLVLAVPDEATPAILEEAEALRELLPNARVFVGEDAKADLLREYGPRAGKLHIAAHGVFRSDNPMFSALLLGDSWLNLVDIFNLKLGAELTTLSACETGMSALYEGDELLGLTRGFLYAGTPSLVVSLWRVSDRSTTLLMRRFYEGLGRGLDKPKALQQAALAVKKEFPHPYHWAPFILMGKS